MKIYCASDFHIGYERSNYGKIKKFLNLAKSDADQLVLCGDIFDLWVSTPEIIMNQEPYKSTYELLLEVGETIPTVIVFGNHDYDLYKKLDLGWIDIKDDFVEDGTYYMHGWRFDSRQKTGSIFYYWIVKYFPYLYQRFFKKPTEIIEREDKIYTCAKIYNEITNSKIYKKYNRVIMGHTHNPILIHEKIGDCGDFVDSCSYITINNKELALKYIE